jgi:serine phosphatase RsbU (regulator of sigma subunit)
MPICRYFISILLFVIVALFSATNICAQNIEIPTLTADDFKDEKSVGLDKLRWKYYAGDDAAWSEKDFDDGGWKSLTNDEINADPLKTLEGWNGRAWFRLRLNVDESLANQPLALRVWHWGASEIYIDGKLIERFGTIKDDGGDEEFNPRGLFVPVVFDGGAHVIAVRQSFRAAENLRDGRGRWLARADYAPGVRIVLESAQGAAARLSRRARSNSFEYVFVGLFVALAAVHLLLFAFYPAARGNLYYSLFVGGLALTIYLNRLYNLGDITAQTRLLTDIARNISQASAIVALLAFLYIEFVGRVSAFFWVIIASWLVCIGLLTAQVSLPFPYFLMMLGVTLIDCLRIIGQSLVKRRAGALNIAAGVGLLVFGVANNIAFERKAHFLPAWLQEYNLYAALLSVPIAVSIYLARNFARTNRHLAAQLAQVRELSDRQLEHERTEADLRLAHEREKSENERRAKELEEARQLQLSMLPKKLPQIPNLEIAAYMKPASEVGGDYYDFYTGEDGTLTVAVGDATGHGLKAGSVVTATKSLFNAFAGEDDITNIFRQSSAALKRMNLRGLYMAMTMLKIKDNHLTVCAAGMPSALIYRSSTKTVEEISIKAMPLGSIANFPYKKQEFTLAAGDAVLLMSDGFPEMFNEADETLGFDEAARILPAVADGSPQQIINHLVEAGEKWANGRPQDDDVTFVVLKVV